MERFKSRNPSMTPAISPQVYLCPSTHDEDWTFRCASGDTTPPDLTEWYTGRSSRIDI